MSKVPTSYTMFVLRTKDRLSFSLMATRLWTISPRAISWCSRVFANDTMEQYTAPSSATVVDIIVRWYFRSVVDGGRKEKRLICRESVEAKTTGPQTMVAHKAAVTPHVTRTNLRCGEKISSVR